MSMRETTPRSPFVDLLVVVILDLHDLVAGTEGPAEPLDADLARRVQRVLQLDVERASAEAAPVHRAEHLDVAYRVKPEALWDPLLHDRQELAHPLLGEQAPAYVKGFAWAVNAVTAARNELDGLLLAELAKPVEPPHRPESDNAP
jgi:hypothetical protein